MTVPHLCLTPLCATQEQCDAFAAVVNSFKDADAVTEEALKKLAPEAAPKKEKKAKKADDKPADEKQAESATKAVAEAKSAAPAAAATPSLGTHQRLPNAASSTVTEAEHQTTIVCITLPSRTHMRLCGHTLPPSVAIR